MRIRAERGDEIRMSDVARKPTLLRQGAYLLKSIDLSCTRFDLESRL